MVYVDVSIGIFHIFPYNSILSYIILYNHCVLLPVWPYGPPNIISTAEDSLRRAARFAFAFAHTGGSSSPQGSNASWSCSAARERLLSELS